MVVLGGYPNTGNPSDADRDYGLHPTIMSGEIGASSETDNIRTLLQASSVKGFVVDGFIIEKGITVLQISMAMFILSTQQVVVKNTVVRNNHNTYNTPGDKYPENSTISLLNNFIDNNLIEGTDLYRIRY